MIQTAGRRSLIVRWVSLFLMLAALLTIPLSGWAAEDRQLDSGPFSISLRGGAVNDTAALGVDGRVDYLNQLLNLHLFGTFDWLESGRGEGEISNTRLGGGFAVSHTFARRANAFAGMSMIREMNRNFGHGYFGGKVKLTDYAILSASYGFGLGAVKEIQQQASTFIAAEAVDWLKVGGALVSGQGMKANLYYHLTDPANTKVSGVEGELSYALLNNLTVGANGSYDITERNNLKQNWRTALFVTYAFGGQKGSPIDIALDKNNPIEYPQIVRKTVQKSTAPAPSVSTVTITRITQVDPIGCTGMTVLFRAAGGTPPYTWYPSSPGTFSDSITDEVWKDFTCQSDGGTVSIYAVDSLGATSPTITFTVLPNSLPPT